MKTSQDKIIKSLQWFCFLLLEVGICWSILGFTHRPQHVGWLTLCSIYTNKVGIMPGGVALGAPLYYIFRGGLGYNDWRLGAGMILTLLGFITAWLPLPIVYLLHLPVVGGLVIRILVLLWLSFIFYWYTLAQNRPVLSLLRKRPEDLPTDCTAA